MAELEEKCRSLQNQQAAVSSPEKEQILTAALSRVDELELQLSETKKVTSLFYFEAYIHILSKVILVALLAFFGCVK